MQKSMSNIFSRTFNFRLYSNILKLASHFQKKGLFMYQSIEMAASDSCSSDGRKRGRSPDSDCDDCLPISKRINKLQIKSAGTSLEDTEKGESVGNNRDLCMNCASLQQGNVQNNQAPLPIQPQCIPQTAAVQHTSRLQHLCDGGTSGCHQCGLCRVNFCTDGTAIQCHDLNANEMDSNELRPEDLAGYAPELTEIENPHYYCINQVLYDAHVERVERHGIIFKNT